MPPIDSLLVVGEVTKLLLGAAVTVAAGRAYRRTEHPSLRALTAGFGLVTFGALLGGLLHWTGVVSPVQGQGVQSLLTGAGLAVIVHSLLLDERRDRSSKEEEPFDRAD